MKLLDILRTLPIRDHQRWRDYVHADFFNRSEPLRRLCALLLEQAPAFNASRDDKHRWYAQLYGQAVLYDDAKMNNLLSDLFGLLCDFLAALDARNEILEQQRQRTKALLDRHLDQAAGGALARFRQLLDQQLERTADWQRQERAYWEMVETLHNRQPRRSVGEHVRRQVEATERLHLLEKARLYVSMTSLGQMAVLDFKDGPMWQEELRQWRAAPSEHQPEAVLVYFAAIDVLEQPNADTFAALERRLHQHDSLFGREDALALYQVALNYCIRRINSGDAAANTDALRLYRTLLERDLLLKNGTLSQWTYKNIATAGLRSGAFEWTADFLETYRDALPNTERANAYAFNLASLYFEQQWFDKTLQTLQKVEFSDITYQMGAKLLQLKTYYRLQEFDALFSLLDATQQLLRRNRSLSEFGRQANLNFLKLLRKIAHWQAGRKDRFPRQHYRLRETLLKVVEQTKPVVNKEWLLRQLL